MAFSRKWLVRLLSAAWFALLWTPPVRGDGIPDWLPRYTIAARLDDRQQRVHAVQRVVWHNRHARPAAELIFSCYPRYQVPEDQIVLMAKTIELLRTAPKAALDADGRRFAVQGAWLVVDNQRTQPLDHEWLADPQTALKVALPQEVRQGQSVAVELEFTIDLPEKQGRWGRWKGTTFLANWHAALAYYDEAGWQPTPFVAWHQPFFHEAGIYEVAFRLPQDHRLASTGTVRKQEAHGDGTKTVHIFAAAARDFAVVCSPRFEQHSAKVGHVTVRVWAYPEHRAAARYMLDIAVEVMPIYEKWFGVYPFDELEIVESHFPWNGNECAGLVMIDERVFNFPKMGEMYLDHLVGHEIMHQWWYNVVGTNGYRETWMDEGVVTFYTARRLQQKYGKNAAMIRLPKHLAWLPNIHHEDYRFYGMYGTFGRKEETATCLPLDKFGNIFTMFSMTYDRGAKIVGLIEEQLGEENFLDFLRIVYSRYQFRVLRIADFQRELEEYTGRRWDRFFNEWIFQPGNSDWAVEKVRVAATDKGGPRRRFARKSHTAPSCVVTIVLSSRGEITPETTLGFRFEPGGPYELRIPVVPSAAGQVMDDPPTRITPLADNRLVVEVELPRTPVQISVDPDQLLVDRDPANNHWKPEIRYRWPLVYTPLEETNLTTAYDRWNVIGSLLWFDRRGHVGPRLGAYRLEKFRGGVYVAYDVDDQDVQLGGDALWDHFLLPHVQLGFNFDHSITPDWADTRRDRGRLFARYVFHYSSSLYLDPMEYVEVYGRVENEFWRGHESIRPGIQRYDDLAAVGVHYHRDYLTPYWDPDAGYRLDLNYEKGFAVLGGDHDYHRLEGEFAVVKGLPGNGWLSHTRLAARARGGIGWPEIGQHFQLGGQNRFRALKRAAREGNAYWIGTLEWRVPLWTGNGERGREDWAEEGQGLISPAAGGVAVYDNVARLEGLYAVAFYEVGEIYLDHRSVGGIAHSLGVGLRFDVAWFSFIERTTFRLDFAKTLNSRDAGQIWVGLSHAF